MRAGEAQCRQHPSNTLASNTDPSTAKHYGGGSPRAARQAGSAWRAAAVACRGRAAASLHAPHAAQPLLTRTLAAPASRAAGSPRKTDGASRRRRICHNRPSAEACAAWMALHARRRQLTEGHNATCWAASARLGNGTRPGRPTGRNQPTSIAQCSPQIEALAGEREALLFLLITVEICRILLFC